SVSTDTNTGDRGQEQGVVVKGDARSDNNLKKVSGDTPVSDTAENSSNQNQDSKSLKDEKSMSGSGAPSNIGNLGSQDESKSIDKKETTMELEKDVGAPKQSSDATSDGTATDNDSLQNDNNNQISEARSNDSGILAQAEKNIRDKAGSIITKVLKNGTEESITSPPSEGDTDGSAPSNTSGSTQTNASFATVQNVTLIPEQITTTSSSMPTDANNNNTDGSIPSSEIDSKCVDHDGIINNSDSGTLD